MRVVVVDCGSGNLASAARALAEAARRSGRAAEVAVSAEPASVARADRIVLPGQGAFAACARGLAAVPGLRAAVLQGAEAGKPFLGICVGMQLMAERGLEHGETPGFGWIAGDIAPLAVAGADGEGGHGGGAGGGAGAGRLRLPHMGWNELAFDAARPHPLLVGLKAGAHAYFVHGYALAGGVAQDCIATTEYGGPVVAMVARGNRAGTQFHVEKSQEVGLRILENFLGWSP